MDSPVRTPVGLALVLAAALSAGCRAPGEQSPAPEPTPATGPETKVSALAATQPARPLADTDWPPLRDVPFETTPDKDIEAAILKASPSYTRAVVDIGEGSGRGRYLYGRVDLNGDGRDEVLVYLLGSIFCGTGGCNLLLFTRNGGSGYSLVDEFPISRLPVIVSAARTNGWNDLVRLESGGGAKPSYVRHTFDGNRYVEREHLPSDTVPEGTRHLAGELTFDKGIPLEPRESR